MIDGSVFSNRAAVVGWGAAALDTVTGTAAEDLVLPAASRATAVKVCDPSGALVVFHAIEYGDTVSSAATCAPSTKNRTPVTPMLSAAVAVTAVVPATVVPVPGAVIVIVGGDVSAAAPVTSKASATTK